MTGDDFVYNGEWLSVYDLIMVEPEDAQKFVSREIIKEDITSNRPSPSHYGVKYSDTLVLSFLVMKEEILCGKQSDAVISGDELHYIRSWLESPKRPAELVVPKTEDEMTVHYYGLFTEVQPYEYEGDCYGLYLTFTCNAPYGYSDEYKNEYDINSSSSSISGKFDNLSAELNEYLKPTITIYSSSTFGRGETITIQNTSDDDNEMSISLPRGLSEIIIDCQKKNITDENGNLISMDDIGIDLPISQDINYISADLYLFNWFSLVPKENIITFTPSRTNTIEKIEISVRYIIKSGGF